MGTFLIRLAKEPWVVFGRLFQCFFCWEYPRQGEPERAQIILTQSSCDRVGRKVGQTNIDLAQVAERLYLELSLPIYPQGDLGILLILRGVKLAGMTPDWSSRAPLSEEYGMGSWDVAWEQAKYCQEHGYKTILLIAFHPHVWRAKWIYERLGLTVIVPPSLPRIKHERDLSHKHWRYAITAYPYELAARLVFLYKGFI